MRTLSILLLAVLLTLAACSTDEATQETNDEQPTAHTARELNFYNWDTYIDPQIIADFESAHNVKINYTIYASNEELYDAMQANPGAYDLVVPTDYMVFRMRSEEMLAPLNYDNIPNFANIDETFVNPVFDPANRYCVPYQWGTFGIGYNRTATTDPITSWEDLFDPRFNGQVALLDEARSSLGLFLIYLGYSPNTTNVTEINQARDFLIANIDRIEFIAPDTGQDLLLAGDVLLTTEWSGDIFQVMPDDENLRYVIPQEGSIIWTDNICIPADAPNKELAEQFINYLLEPEVGAQLSDYIRYASPNSASLPLINPDDLNNPSLYPPANIRERLFFQIDVGADGEALYTEAWQAVLDAHAKRGEE